MKNKAVWFAVALLASGMIPDVIAFTFSRHIPVANQRDVTDIMTNIVTSIRRDFLDGLRVQETDVQESGCYYYQSEDLLKFYFVLSLPNDHLVSIRSGKGNPSADINLLKRWFPECPKAILKKFTEGNINYGWKEWATSAKGLQIQRQTYVSFDEASIIVMGVNWRRTPPSSDGAVVPTGPTIVILPPGSEPWRKSPESETSTTAQILGDRQLAVSFVEELIRRINGNEDISVNEGLRLFPSDGQLIEFQLLRQLGYVDVSGERLKPYPDLSCFGMLLKMKKGLFSSVAGDTPVVDVTDLSSSSSTNGKTRVSSFKVILTYNQENGVLDAVSDAKQKTIIFDVHVKTFGKGERGSWVDFHTALVDGKNVAYLLGFRTMDGMIPDHKGGPSLSRELYTLQEDELRQLKAFMEESVKGGD